MTLVFPVSFSVPDQPARVPFNTMVAPSNSPENAKRALVVQHDPHTRNLIQDQLQNCGFWVDACANLHEGKNAYQNHPLVFSSLEKDAQTPQGLIGWIRERHASVEEQPYIVAVGEPHTPLTMSPEERLWNELITIPLSHAQLRTRLRAIEPLLKLPAPPSADSAPQRGKAPQAIFEEDIALTAELVSPPEDGFKPNPRLTESFFYPGIQWSGAVGDRERVQALVDNVPLSMAMFDQNMRYLVVNGHWVQDYGLEGVDLIGRSHYEVFPEIGAEWRQVFDQALQGQPQSSKEDLWIRADGSQDWVSWEVKPWFNSANEVGGVTFTCQTIRSKNTAHPEEKDLEPFAQSLMRGNLTPVLCLDMDGTIRQANQAAAAFVDDPSMKIVGELYWEVFSLPERRGEMRREFLNFSEQTRQSNFFLFPQNMADTVRLSSGRIAPLVWSVSPRQDSHGGIAGVILVGVILDRNALSSPLDAPEAPAIPEPAPVRPLSHYTEHPEEILERVSFGVILLDMERNTVYANAEHHRMLGYDIRDYSDIEEWIRAAAPDPKDPETPVRTWREAVWQRQSVKTLKLKAQNQMMREIEFRPRPTSEGGLILTIFDVTEKRKGEELMRANEAKFRALFFHAGLPIVLEDPNGRFSSANPLFERLINVEGKELSRYGMQDWVHPEDWPQLEANLGQLKAVPDSSSNAIPVRVFRHGGDYVKVRASASRIVDQTGKLVFTAFLFQDPSVSLQDCCAEEEVIQAMRHRIRNDLQLISSLAGIQLGSTAAAHSRQILRQSQERIQTIAHLYQLLGATEALPTGVSVASFLSLQRNSLLRTFDADAHNLKVRLVCEDIILSPSHALAIGFTFGEILAEVFRFAIGRGQAGAVIVRLRQNGDVVDFRIEDDGLEFPDTLWRADEENSIVEIIHGLAEQLQADLQLEPGPPSSVSMRFAIAQAGKEA